MITQLAVNFKMREGCENLIPKYAHIGDAGMDLLSREEITIYPGETKLVKTGLFIEIPEGYMGHVNSKSGLALKHGLFVTNSPGVVDATYRGEVGVILSYLIPTITTREPSISGCGADSCNIHMNINVNKPFVIKRGMKIAQLIIVPVMHANLYKSRNLSDSSRGEGGFGSTGR